MERLNKIIEDKRYKLEMKKIKMHEDGRKFCGHDKKHFIDVSRILYTLCLEEKLGIKKELVYAIGFLHDIGRGVQYEEGISHDKGSSIIAKKILPECGFDSDEIGIICNGIEEHRKYKDDNTTIGKLTYKADKMSRECWDCKVRGECNWKNIKEEIIY